MRSWRPFPSPARYLLPLLLLLCTAVAFWLWSKLSERTANVGYDTGVFGIGLAFFLVLVLIGLLAYIAWCIFTMGYTVSEDALALRSGGSRYIVPLASIMAVYLPGATISGRAIKVKWQRATALPGFLLGAGQSAQLGRVLAVATVTDNGLVFIATQGKTFAISPQNSFSFVEALEKAREEGKEYDAADESATRAELRGGNAWAAPLWYDPVARWLFLSGLLLSAALFFYLSLVYTTLPALLALHWNAQAQVDRVGDPTELLRLPVFALAVWLVNAVVAFWAIRRERAAALFLLAGAACAQIVFAAGALSIVLRT
ncbi:MAG: hypothetical protein IVW55_07135 [Chloroflexi bacterium]|nr:hypothetical protein [Chloroflexota bacterium]